MPNLFRNRPRIQLLVLASSAAILTSALNLTAYLEDKTETRDDAFFMRYGEELGIDITAPNYAKNASITPGASAAYDPTIINTGNYDAYVFIEIDYPTEAPDAFSLSGLSSDWYCLSRDGGTAVYAYGSAQSLTVLDAMTKQSGTESTPTETAPLCTDVSLNENPETTDGEGKTTPMVQGSYVVSATGYAIQSDGIGSSDPATVWKMIGSEA